MVEGDATANGTKVVRHDKTVVFDRPAYLTRTNEAGFNFVSFSGSETNAIIQFEATGEYVALFALGCDRNGDGWLTSAEGEIGPAFGVFERKLRIQEANLGPRTTMDSTRAAATATAATNGIGFSFASISRPATARAAAACTSGT